MNLALPSSLARVLAAALLCLALLGTPTPAAAAPPAAVCAAGPAPVLVASGWNWNKFWNVVEGNLNSRAALLRLGTVGMFIALFIIMRNKW